MVLDLDFSLLFLVVLLMHIHVNHYKHPLAHSHPQLLNENQRSLFKLCTLFLRCNHGLGEHQVGEQAPAVL